MVVRIWRFASSLLRNNFSQINQIRNSSRFVINSTSPYQFLLRRRLVSAASAVQQVSPASSTNPPTTKDANKEKANINAEPVTVTFVTSDGTRHTVQGKEGDSLLDLVIDKQVPLDGYGACEGTLACSTCHVILNQKDFDRLPEKPTDEELDMLDLAYGISDTSRLGCQIILKKEFDGLEVLVPAGVYDARTS